MLIADSVWEAFGAKSYEEYCTKIAKPFILPTALPQPFKEELLIVHKLLEHAYFECKFIDIALLQTTVLFEKILKHIYCEVEGKESKDNFYGLIEYFADRHYFEASNAKTVLHIFRDIRNKKVHALKPPGGLLTIQWIYDKLIYHINDLYEDRQLREERLEERKKLQILLSTITSGGATLEINGKSYILFDAKVLFINNKKKPADIWIAFWPTYDLTPYLDGKHHYSIKPWTFKISDPVIINTNCIEVKNDKGERMVLNGELEEIFSFLYSDWLQKANALPNFQLALQLKDSISSDLMSEILNEFYSTSIVN
jgi:hypothetical protein